MLVEEKKESNHLWPQIRISQKKISIRYFHKIWEIETGKIYPKLWHIFCVFTFSNKKENQQKNSLEIENQKIWERNQEQFTRTLALFCVFYFIFTQHSLG